MFNSKNKVHRVSIPEGNFNLGFGSNDDKPVERNFNLRFGFNDDKKPYNITVK